jgi:hypothetical protein
MENAIDQALITRDFSQTFIHFFDRDKRLLLITRNQALITRDFSQTFIHFFDRDKRLLLITHDEAVFGFAEAVAIDQ